MQTPTLTDELKRKTTEAISWLIDQAAKGNITDAQLSVAADAVWMTASGLVGDTLLDAMTVIEEETKTASTRISIAFTNDEFRLSTISYTPDGDHVLVAISGLPPKRFDVDNSNRRFRVGHMISVMEKKGYRRL